MSNYTDLNAKVAKSEKPLIAALKEHRDDLNNIIESGEVSKAYLHRYTTPRDQVQNLLEQLINGE